MKLSCTNIYNLICLSIKEKEKALLFHNILHLSKNDILLLQKDFEIHHVI